MSKERVSQPKQEAVRLSNRQFGQLRAVEERYTVGLEELATYNQNTVGANFRRHWIAVAPGGHGIRLTHEGRQALDAFNSADFFRRVASCNFSSYLDLPVGPRISEKIAAKRAAQMHIVRKSKAA